VSTSNASDARRTALFAPDHKVIARRYLWMGFAFLLLGGLLAMNLRWSHAYPGRATPFLGSLLHRRTGGVIGPADYQAVFTAHGTIMIFFAVTPLVIGWLGNQTLPLMLGARTMALPVLNGLGFWFTLAGGLTLLGGMLLPAGGPIAGWTAYPPLASAAASPGAGQTLFGVAILLACVGTLMGALSFVTTIVRRRAPGMGYFRMPLTVWGLWMASVLNLLFVPVLAVGTALLLSDRVAGTSFFVPQGGGDPLLYQHLFWIFGHPEVYIVILPVWGVVSDLLAVFARKPAFGYRATALSMVAVSLLSALVYGHHMFVTGIGPLLAQAFMTLTILVAIPSAVFFLNWLGTLWQGSIRLRPPMVYALGMMLVFAVGGLTGMHLGAITTDVYLHDSYFVVGHFHLVMAAAVLLGAFAAIHYWFPKTFGRMLHEPLAHAHALLTLVLLVVVFGGMLALGWAGMMRRIYDTSSYAFLLPTATLNRGLGHAAFTLFAVQGLFVLNVVWTLVAGPRAPANPWQAASLEWSVSSPPPPHNFDAIPTVLHGPHEYAHPWAAPGRDWLMQDEEPHTPPAARESA
jgi:cytochrome c oxidase subunit 1